MTVYCTLGYWPGQVSTLTGAVEEQHHMSNLNTAFSSGYKLHQKCRPDKTTVQSSYFFARRIVYISVVKV